NTGVEEGATMWQPSWACPTDGYFYPPTLFTNVSPAATIAQVEIFGPVLVSMTFRTPAEAVELANNTPYGLAASVWTEHIILAPSGALLAEVAEGNRKDIRNAVEAAHAADGWAKTSGHNRGQVLYYLAENLAQRADEFAARIAGMTGRDLGDARREVDASIA